MDLTNFLKMEFYSLDLAESGGNIHNNCEGCLLQSRRVLVWYDYSIVTGSSFGTIRCIINIEGDDIHNTGVHKHYFIAAGILFQPSCTEIHHEAPIAPAKPLIPTTYPITFRFCSCQSIYSSGRRDFSSNFGATSCANTDN